MNEPQRRRATLVVLAVALAGVLVLAMFLGSVRLPVLGVLGALASGLGVQPGGAVDPSVETIVLNVRLPRVLLGALVGGGLAVVGAALQAVFRNPMADSGLLGVGSGAALGAVVAERWGWAARTYLALPAAAFVGALGAVLLVYVLVHASGRPTLHGLLLTGLAVSAMGGAGTSIFLVATDEFRVKAVLFWIAGGLEARSWHHLGLGGGLILLGAALLWLLARPLDLLSLGEEEAASLGLRVPLVRLSVLSVSALVAGAATAVSGSVAFVGLVVPHALRPLVGPLGRHLLPAAFLGGALLVVVADTLGRTLAGGVDLPLGALTALVGAPYFLVALRGGEGDS